jgi:hypothetical protein
MCQDFEWAIPFNIGNPPPPLLRGLDILWGGGSLRNFQKIAKIRCFSDIQGGKNDILKGVYEDIHGVTSKNHIQGGPKMFIS